MPNDGGVKTMKTIYAMTVAVTLVSTSAMAQSPTPPNVPAPQPQPTQFETRGVPNSEQQLREWQQERADEYYRRLREYVASVARMA